MTAIQGCHENVTVMATSPCLGISDASPEKAIGLRTEGGVGFYQKKGVEEHSSGKNSMEYRRQHVGGERAWTLFCHLLTV